MVSQSKDGFPLNGFSIKRWFPLNGFSIKRWFPLNGFSIKRWFSIKWFLNQKMVSKNMVSQSLNGFPKKWQKRNIFSLRMVSFK